MLGKRKVRYAVVTDQLDEEIEEIDFPDVKRNIFTHACMWNSMLTCALILTYFAPSITLTFYQRWLLQKIPFPLSVILVHMFVKFALAAIIRSLVAFKQGQPKLTISWRDYVIKVSPVGLTSGIDIGFSNWGLELLTVSLYTMTKSTTIVFILGFAILLKLEKKSWSLSFIVIMISIGLILFTYKATQFNLLGFTLLILASMSSGLRWTCAQLLLQKSKMGMRNPIDMIYFMQPWMIASLIPFALWIEGPALITHCQLLRSKDNGEFTYLIILILIGAGIAFFMEATEVMVVTYTSSLTLSVAGIFKELFILILAVSWNGDQMSFVNVIGLVVCLLGITGHVLHKLRSSSSRLGNNHTSGGSGSSYHGDEDNLYEQRESLLDNAEATLQLTSESDTENDTQVIFNILNSRDR